MEDQLLSSPATVTDPKAAAVFANARLRRVLMLFAAGPLSISKAAARSGVDLKKLHHQVSKLARLGLLVVAEVRPRAGRAIKLYQTSSEAFFVPVELLPRNFGDDLARELRTYLEADARRTMKGMFVGAGPEGQIRARIVTDEFSEPRTAEIWRILRLERDEAKALASELRAVLDKFEQNASGRGEVYLVHTAMAQRLSEGGPVDNPRA